MGTYVAVMTVLAQVGDPDFSTGAGLAALRAFSVLGIIIISVAALRLGFQGLKGRPVPAVMALLAVAMLVAVLLNPGLLRQTLDLLGGWAGRLMRDGAELMDGSVGTFLPRGLAGLLASFVDLGAGRG